MTGQISVLRPAKNGSVLTIQTLQVDHRISNDSIPVISVISITCQVNGARVGESRLADLLIELMVRSVVISGVPCQARLCDR